MLSGQSHCQEAEAHDGISEVRELTGFWSLLWQTLFLYNRERGFLLYKKPCPLFYCGRLSAVKTQHNLTKKSGMTLKKYEKINKNRKIVILISANSCK